jgi:hypothetical protein
MGKPATSADVRRRDKPSPKRHTQTMNLWQRKLLAYLHDAANYPIQ